MTTRRQDLAKLQEAAFTQGLRGSEPTPMTVAEILEAIRVAHDRPEPENAYTGPEIRDAMGWGSVRFAKEMAKMKAAGQVTLAQVRRTASDGRTMRINGYRLVG